MKCGNVSGHLSHTGKTHFTVQLLSWQHNLCDGLIPWWHKLTLCIPAVYMLSVCAAQSSRQYTHSSILSRDCKPVGHSCLTWGALKGGMVMRERKSFKSSFVFVCVVTKTKWDLVTQGFVLPGNVVLTVKLDTQVISSSPPVQSSFPSQALSIGMNFTERLQKKYLLSMSCLTGRWRSDSLKETGRAQSY